MADVGDVIRLADGGLVPVLEHVQREVEDALTTGPESVVLDLGALPATTPTGVAALLWAQRQCAAAGVPVVLSNASAAWIGLLRHADLVPGAFAVAWPPLTRASQCGTV